MKLASRKSEQTVVLDQTRDAEEFEQCCLYMVIRNMYVDQ